MEKRNVELLAPAGNYECFLGAIQAGADAVYLGGSKFSARAYADNFTDEEICKAILYAHVCGKKVYMTVNTLLKDGELSELVPYMKPFYKAGLDGVIVQDFGVFTALKEAFSGLSLHASTQMTLTGSMGTAFLQSLGAERIVPARELSLQEIRKIKEDTGIEIEVFVHGAMCYCYSGQCLMSSIIGGRSGNRGRCAQPCRLPYQVETAGGSSGKKEVYPLSMKDMCTLSILPDLIEAGVDSFKIEGRMKKAEYAAGVTSVYRKYIDRYFQVGREGYRVDKKDLEFLSSLYIRSQIQDGYYYKQNGADMITLNSPAYNGSEESVLKRIRETYIDVPAEKKKKAPVSMEITLHVGKPAAFRVKVLQTEREIFLTGPEVDKAQKNPITEENVRKCFGKLGDTFFAVSPEQMHIEMDADCFYPLKTMNELRRQGMEKLLKLYYPIERTENKAEEVPAQENTAAPDGRTGQAGKDTAPECAAGQRKAAANGQEHAVLVQKKEQLTALLESDFSYDTVYLESDFRNEAGVVGEAETDACRNGGKKVYIALPFIVRDKDKDFLKKLLPLMNRVDGVLVRNLETLGFLQKNDYKGNIRLDAGMYCFNKKTVSFYEPLAESYCMPYELNHREQKSLSRMETGILTEHVVYGRIPLMVTANCTQRTMEKCIKSAHMGENRLRDRYRKEFPVMLHCRYCYNVILNSVPLSLHDTISIQTDDILRIQFTSEDYRETKAVLKFFKNRMEGGSMEPPFTEFTKGHEKRGVD